MCARRRTSLDDPPTPGGTAYGIAVVLTLLLSCGLRFWALDRLPLPIHQDELSDIYDGYSLATTGADRWGESWPILLRGMGPGDYHPPLYAYCAAVSTKLLGFSVWAGRLPAALAGALTVLLVYLAARRLLPPSGALIALLFVTFSPIHILYSRQAHQGVCLMPLVVIGCLYLLLRLVEAFRDSGVSRRTILWAATTGLAIGLSTNAYAAMRLIAPLWAIMAAVGVVVIGRRGGRGWRDCAPILGVLIAATTLGASPQLYAAVTQPAHFFARSRATVYAFSNGVTWWVRNLAVNLFRELDPRYLFLSFGEYNALSVARLSVVEMPFFYVGLVGSVLVAWRRRNWTLAILPMGVVICLLPSIVTRGGPSPMRSSGVWALYPIVSAIGVSIVGTVAVSVLRSPNAVRTRRVAAVAVGACVAALGLFNVGRFLADESLHGPASQHHLVLLGQRLGRENLDDFERIYVDADGMFAYLYAAAFAGLRPSEFQKLPRHGFLRGLGWEEYDTLGRFYFRSAAQARADRHTTSARGRWLVVSHDGTKLDVYALTERRIAQTER